MTADGIPTVCVVGYSNTGKTSLITAAVRRCKTKGLRVAVLKYSSHGGDFDRPGSDTDLYGQAGAGTVAFVGSAGVRVSVTAVSGHDPLDAQPTWLRQLLAEADVLFVEGRVFPGALTVLTHRRDASGSGTPKFDPADFDLMLTEFPATPEALSRIDHFIAQGAPPCRNDREN